MSSRPTRDEYLMLMARVTAMRGTCSRLSVGCVVARDGRVLVTGYNGAPAGMPHCDHSTDREMAPGHGQVINRYFVNDQWQNTPQCRTAVHDMANAVAFAARNGVCLEHATVYSTDSPCLECAKLIINAGIARVVYEREYRLSEGLDLLRNAKIVIEQLSIYTDIWP